MKHTPLYAQHEAAHAKIVDFHGWALPIHYGSQLQEHQAVRTHAGLFDVSHMMVTDIQGPDATSYLRRLLANDIAKLTTPGKALYSLMLNPQGGVIDDLIAYRLADRVHESDSLASSRPHTAYRMVTNGATRPRVRQWLQEQRQNDDLLLQEQPQLALIAIQGPQARALFVKAMPQIETAIAALTPFHSLYLPRWVIARTGYTGEDGLEIMLPDTEAAELWQRLVALGAQPCGLGARDTLRLEAGLNLYGADMDETTSPLAANLAWTIAWDPEDRLFIGRAALEEQRLSGQHERLIGLVLMAAGVMRAGYSVQLPNQASGVITSGSFSPTLQQSIALARVPNIKTDQVTVVIRDKRLPAKIVAPPFVRKGQKTY